MNKEPKIEWLNVWVVNEGNITQRRAFIEEDSIIFEGDDERYDYDDPRHIHVDDLTEGNGIFDNEGEATLSSGCRRKSTSTN